jgi:hypothetical protein
LAVACPPLQPNAAKYFENSLFFVIRRLTSSAAAHIVITKKVGYASASTPAQP